MNINNDVKNIKLSSVKKQEKTAVSTPQPKTVEEPFEYEKVGADTLKAYFGVHTKQVKEEEFVSRDEFKNYLETATVFRKDLFDNVADSVADENGNISQKAFEIFKSFCDKKHMVLDSMKIFENSKVNGKLDYNVLSAVDGLMKPAEPYDYSSQTFGNIVSMMKDKNHEFNPILTNVIKNHPDKFEKYIQHFPENLFKCVKNADGTYSSDGLKLLANLLDSGEKLQFSLGRLMSGKDKQGNFDLSILNLSDDIEKRFDKDKYTQTAIRSQALELPPEKRSEFINFAESIKDEEQFRKILDIFNEFKYEHNEKSLDFVKKVLKLSRFNEEQFSLLVKTANLTPENLTEDKEKTLNKLCNVVEPKSIPVFINASIRKAGKDKGEWSAQTLEKYLDIYDKNRYFGPELIENMGKRLSLEEDDKALSVFNKLHNLRWKSDYGNEQMLDKGVLNFIMEMLVLSSQDGEPKRKCYSKAVDGLEKLMNMDLPMSSKDAFENFILYQDFEAIEKIDKINFEELGLKTEQITKGMFQSASEETLLRFKEYLKGYLKDKNPKDVVINYNPNIGGIIELRYGPSYNNSKVLYNLEKGIVTNEKTERTFLNTNRVLVTQKDTLHNNESEMYYRLVTDNHYNEYKVLVSQNIKWFDDDGNLICEEIMEESPIKNVYNVTKKYPDGRVEVLTKAERDKKGNDFIEKSLTSLDGTKTYYKFEDDEAGNRILDYKITDKNGKVLMNQSNTFEVIDENHFVSSRNNVKYDIKVKDDVIFVKNLKNNESAKIELENFTKSTISEVLPILKKFPGDELIKMKKIDLKAFYNDNTVNNAAFSPKDETIMFDEKYGIIAVLLHEFGHAKDSMMYKEINEKIADDPKLNEIFNKEKTAFRNHFGDDQLSHIGYFAADSHYLGSKAVKEGIAETNTVLNVYPKNDVQSVRSHYWMQYFPNTIAYLNNLLN